MAVRRTYDVPQEALQDPDQHRAFFFVQGNLRHDRQLSLHALSGVSAAV